MAAIFDEENMRRVFGRYLPDGETLLAGIHAVAKEMEMDEFFGNCEIKNGILGSKKCLITAKGGYLKLLLPKLGGIGGGMPHYSEYKEKIIDRLSACSK